MRPVLLIAAVAMCSGLGCTHTALERRTVKQASTLTDLQYQQVLDNAAMFACNPESLAWHLKLTGGSVQVTDQGTARFETGFGLLDSMIGSRFIPEVSAQRGVVNQWSGVPAVDSDDLELLQLAYQKAVHPQDEDGRIRQAIYEKVCELSVSYNVLLTHETATKLIGTMKSVVNPKTGKPETPEEFSTRKWELMRKHEQLHKELEKQQEGLSKLAAAPSPAEIATFREQNKMTDEPTARERLTQNRRQEKERLFTVQRAVEDQLVKLTREICDLPYIPRYPITGRPEHNVHEVDQIQAKIKTLLELADNPKYAAPWVCTGRTKKDVPKCACYVGHYRNCGCDCYVWVLPEQRATLRDFTLAVLTLAPPERQDSSGASPNGGVIFSPTISGGSR